MLILETQQKERNRMASDLHDELGSGLSTIRFLSESMKLKTVDNVNALNVISSKSAELIDNMRQIIWSINPEFNNLNELLLFMKKYCGEYLAANKMDWNFKMPYHVPAIALTVDARRNIFSAFKEALHNVIKHAEANTVDIAFECASADSNYLCSLKIADNGKGFSHVSQGASGNGLRNMDKRMKEIGGEFVVRSANGTAVFLTFSLAK
jgi:signal transduction histidine kinase